MKYRNYFFGTLILLSLISACEKDTNFDIGKQPSKLVINGYVETGRPFEVFVSRSASILDAVQRREELDVPDAKIFLYANDVLIDSFRYNDPGQSYTTWKGTIAQPGIRYKLTTTAPELPTVEAEAFLADRFPTLLGNSVRREVKKIDGELMDEVRIRIADPEGVRNYYFIKLITPFYFGGNEVTYVNFNSVGCIYSNDPDVDDAGIDPLFSRCLSNEIFVSDKNFDGNEKEFVLFVPANSLMNAQIPGEDKIYSPIVEITSITEDYYKYRRSIDRYDMASDNPFAEPVNIFTNIHNGFGVFGIGRAQVDTIRQ